MTKNYSLGEKKNDFLNSTMAISVKLFEGYQFPCYCSVFIQDVPGNCIILETIDLLYTLFLQNVQRITLNMVNKVVSFIEVKIIPMIKLMNNNTYTYMSTNKIILKHNNFH